MHDHSLSVLKIFMNVMNPGKYGISRVLFEGSHLSMKSRHRTRWLYPQKFRFQRSFKSYQSELYQVPCRKIKRNGNTYYVSSTPFRHKIQPSHIPL